MYVECVVEDEATGVVRELYEDELAEDGYVSNTTRLFSLNPAALQAWAALRRSISEQLDFRRYELATLAAAMALRCRYCVSAHSDVIESNFYSREQLEAIVRDYRNAGLEPADVAIMAFAQKVALHAYRVTEQDVEELRSHGLGDVEIFNLTLTAAARSFLSKTVDAMGAQPDEALAATTPLFDLVDTGTAAST